MKMNKYQKAIKELTDLVHSELDGTRMLNEHIGYIETLEELVDKATPKKPIKVNKTDDPSIREGSLVSLVGHCYRCPNCNSFLGTSFLQISMYCKHCGQKLDWSDEDE